MSNFIIKKIHKDAKMPKRIEGSVGYDISTIEQVNIFAGATVPIRTGLILKFPEGYFGILTLRSSMSTRGIIMPHGIGIIDPSYDDELLIKVRNISGDDVSFEKGERIAQLILLPIFTPEIQCDECSEVGLVTRGGFGSTGKF